MRLTHRILVGILAVGAASGRDEPRPEGGVRAVEIAIEDRVVATVDPRFLSFTLDAAQVVGGVFWDPAGDVAFGFGSERVPEFDFDRPRLRALTAALAPAYLRIGGSEADRIRYDLSDEPGPPGPGYEEVLTRAQWDAIGDFATDLDLDLVFTLNAGPANRTEGRWTPTQAETLVRYAAARGDPVAVWELGNEVNGYGPLFGWSARVDGETYAADLRTARALLDRTMPAAQLSGPSSAIFPMLGEPFALLEDTLAAGGRPDVLAWHFYPTQSERCPFASRRATADRILDPEVLDEVHRRAAVVEAARDAHAPGTPIWLGETGQAQCGGQRGLSDTFAGTFWWMDQLGGLARRGHQVVARQTLTGSNYGLLDDRTLEPRPDYWASVLFKRLMGPRVLPVVSSAPRLRAYAQCAQDGATTLLAINLDDLRPAALSVEATRRWVLTGAALDATTVQLNGRALELEAGWPDLSGEAMTGRATLPPASIGFFRLPPGTHSACRTAG